MKYNFALLFTLALSTICFGGKLPSEYQRCKRDDSNFSKCLKSAIEDALTKLDNGIPSLKVPPLQPLYIPSITIGEGKGTVNVIQHYKNVNIYDIRNFKIEKFDVRITSNDLKLEMQTCTPEVRFEAEYNINGRVLLMPVNGDGKCTVKLEQMKTNMTVFAETFEKKGKTYLKVKNSSIKLTPGKVVFNFENLFNGDERLGSEMNKLLNDNWRDVYDDIGEQYMSMLQVILGDYANRIFTKVPYDDLF